MNYRFLGRTGLRVSPFCLGTMNFGNHTAEPEAHQIMDRALDLGINFFDTANVYSDGTSEEIVGRALKDFARREEIVLATKVRGRMSPGPNGEGLSRKAIFAELDNSLRRLGTDYVDLYQIHRLDHSTPIEETLEALHDLVKAGKVRYIGASSMYAWQFAKALYISRAHGWTPFVSMQNHLNLLYREEEREMLPLCTDQKIAVLPWSPLARGRLARAANETTERNRTDNVTPRLYDQTAEADRLVIDAVGTVAAKRGVPRAQIALGWLLQKAPVTAPIVGASKASQLTDAVSALTLGLDAEEIAALEAPYVPHAISAFQ